MVNPDLIRSALGYINPSIPRDDWVRVGMAIKSEFPDDVGYSLFDEWSKNGEKYKSRDTASAWKSFKSVGGVSIGTLFAMAKESGFVMPKNNESIVKPTPEQIKEQAAKRTEATNKAKQNLDALHRRIGVEAELKWSEATETGINGYLIRKGVKPYGVRFNAAGDLLVPVKDVLDGKMWSIQTIKSKKPEGGAPEKLFLKDGKKSGCCHLLGEITKNLLLICEGYSTGASLHEATGYAVAVAFDAGNLHSVCGAFRKKYPTLRLLVCGDDDISNPENPGRDKAEKAARAISGLAVFPIGLSGTESDFNDMHLKNGLQSVAECVNESVEKLGTKSSGANKKTSNPETSTDKKNDIFYVDDETGLWCSSGENEILVCPPIYVSGRASDSKGNQNCLVLEFRTNRNKTRKWLMPCSMLAGDGAAYRSELLNMGFNAPIDFKKRLYLTQYLQSRKPDRFITHVPKTGWYGDYFVLPEETLGRDDSKHEIIFHSETGIEANFSQKGSIEEWRSISRLCEKNTRMTLASCVSFAGALLPKSDATGGGFHLVGETSTGKTTGFLIAASIWGKGTESDPDSFIQKWRATSNGLEYLGEQHNHCCLILDELGQMEHGDAGSAAYMLADGQGKNRSKGSGGLRTKPTWNLLFLSSGELTLAQQMDAVGKRIKGGQEVRLIPIPSEVAPGSAIEYFHNFKSGHEFSAYIRGQTSKHYGLAGRAWLDWLVKKDDLNEQLKKRMQSFENSFVPDTSSGQVKRGGKRFALAAAAGEMATEAGITGWPKGWATQAVAVCFNDWVSFRGGIGSSDDTETLKHIRHFLLVHSEGRFNHWERIRPKNDSDIGDTHKPNLLNIAGYKKSHAGDGGLHFYIYPEVFEKELCKDRNIKVVARLLKEKGFLKTDGDHLTYQSSLPGSEKNIRMYVIKPQILDSVSD
jgi:putative DNA primase/helicase